MKEAKMNDDLEEKLMKSVDGILSALNILKIATDVQDYENWLRAYHNKEIDNELVEGYKFFITTVIRFLIHIVEIDTSLDLEEDFTFFRARFKGVSIKDIPNTSEKTIFIKNVWNLSKSLRRGKNWKDIKVSIERLNPLSKMFEQIYENSTPTINMSKDIALNIVTKFYALNFLNNIHHGLPYGYISPSTVRTSISSKYLKKVFNGYTLTLQYLWFKLLGKDDFDKFRLKDLYGALETCAEKYSDEETGFEEWYALDSTFDKINGKIIKPLIDDLNLHLGFEPLLVIKNIDKNAFRPLLSKEKLQEPKYFEKKSKEDIKKWLDCKLFWYNVEVLCSTGSIFSGVPAFVLTLVGSVKVGKDIPYIRIFKHPVEKGKYSYSYGILIPSFGSMGFADYSGWLIFFDCARDYSGFGGFLYTLAKSFIDTFRKVKAVKVEEIEVEKDIFREYLKERSVSSIFERAVIHTLHGEVTVLDISEFLENARGFLFELMVYKWVQSEREKVFYDDVKHGYSVDGEEIDVFLKKGNKIYLWECKVTIHKDSMNKTLRQILRKMDVVKSKYPKCEVIPVLITYSILPAERKKFFEEHNINVKDGFSEKISKSGLFSKDKKRLIDQILGLQDADNEFDLEIDLEI